MLILPTIISVPRFAEIWGTTSVQDATNNAIGFMPVATSYWNTFAQIALFVMGFIIGALILKFILYRGAYRGVKMLFGGGRRRRR